MEVSSRILEALKDDERSLVPQDLLAELIEEYQTQKYGNDILRLVNTYAGVSESISTRGALNAAWDVRNTEEEDRTAACAEVEVVEDLKLSTTALHCAEDELVARLYDPIPVSQNQGRLLRLHYGAPGTPLRGDLIVANVPPYSARLQIGSRYVTYQALSYTWGTGSLSNQIILNGVPWPITENLFDFLWQRRSEVEGGDSLVWIDALCINQHDDGEKTEQVSNMVRFYERASLVIAWLGKAIPEDEAAVNFLYEMLYFDRKFSPT